MFKFNDSKSNWFLGVVVLIIIFINFFIIPKQSQQFNHIANDEEQIEKMYDDEQQGEDQLEEDSGLEILNNINDRITQKTKNKIINPRINNNPINKPSLGYISKAISTLALQQKDDLRENNIGIGNVIFDNKNNKKSSPTSYSGFSGVDNYPSYQNSYDNSSWGSGGGGDNSSSYSSAMDEQIERELAELLASLS